MKTGELRIRLTEIENIEDEKQEITIWYNSKVVPFCQSFEIDEYSTAKEYIKMLKEIIYHIEKRVENEKQD